MSSFKSTEYHSLIKLPMLDVEYQSMIRVIASYQKEKEAHSDPFRRYLLADLGMQKMLKHLNDTVHTGNWGVDVFWTSARVEPSKDVAVELALVLSGAVGTNIHYRENPSHPEHGFTARIEPDRWHLCVADVYRDIVFPRNNPEPSPLYILTCPYLGKQL